MSAALTPDEQEVFDLVNQQRMNNGLSALKVDSEVQRVAKIKAQDMVSNNYFSHNSPTYGSPFDMLNSFKVSYKSAAENIAGNSSNRNWSCKQSNLWENLCADVYWEIIKFYLTFLQEGHKIKP